jgi:hypothetical protein
VVGHTAPIDDGPLRRIDALDRGATLAAPGIWLTDIPSLHYEAELSWNAGCAA